MIISIHQWCARRGARLMDSRRPGWARRIHQDRLDLMSGLNCILGQEYGTYERGRRILGLSFAAVLSHGFITLPKLAQGDQVTAAWHAEIEARLPAPVTRRHVLAA